MVKWIRHNHWQPCPVCHQTKKGCRTNAKTNITHCRGEHPDPAYRFLKQDKHGFGMFKLEAEIQEFAEEKWQEWLEQKQREREQKQRQWERELKKQLTSQQRDEVIRQILAQLSLSQQHREQLQSRGFSDQQIDEAGYRSVGKWQRLSHRVSPKLAGVSRGGDRLITPDSGILIPIPDENGQWVGYQLRRDHPEDNNKYLWSASEKNRDNRPDIKNREGELPLGVWGRDRCHEDGVVYLCESPGIKPWLASIRFNRPVIGAAGNNFPSSPKALQRALGALQAKKVIMVPDAGAIINDHIHHLTKQTISLLNNWHYTVMIAWWGQIDKTEDDIDEIDGETFAAIEELTPGQYYFKYRQQQQKRQSEQQQQWQQQTYKQQAHQAWQQRRKFSPDHVIKDPDDPFLKLDCLPSELPEGMIYAIKSPIGTGQTELLSKLVSLFNQIGEGSTFLGHRNLLLRQTASRVNGHLLIDAERGEYTNGDLEQAAILSEELKDDPEPVLLLALDSLFKFDGPWQFQDKNIFIDETTTVILHLLLSMTEIRKHRKPILSLFEQGLQICKRIFLTDGMLSDRVCDYIQKLSGKQLYKVENQAQKPVTFNVLTGVNHPYENKDGTISKKLKPNNKSPLIDYILKAECPMVVSDNQVLLEALDNWLQEQGKQGIRIDGKTSGEDEIKALMKDINQGILDNQPDYLLLSPSGQDGIDIHLQGYFSDLFCLYHGIINVTSAHQFSFRLRDPNVDRWLWAQVFNEGTLEHAQSPFAGATKQNHQELLLNDLKLTWGDKYSEEQLHQVYELIKSDATEEIHYDYWSNLVANEHYERHNFRDCLMESLAEEGHHLVEFHPNQTDDFQQAHKTLKDEKKAVKEYHSKQIYEAEDIDPNSISEHQTGKLEDQWKIEKAKIKQKVPGIEMDECWHPKVIEEILFNDPLAIAKIKRRIMLHNPEKAQILQKKKWRRILKGYDHKFHLRSEYLKVKAFQDAGFEQILEHLKAGYPIQQDDPILLEFMERCQTAEFKLATGRSPSNDSQPIKWLNWCLTQFGYSSQQYRKSGYDARRYYLDTLPRWSESIEMLIIVDWNDSLIDHPDIEDILRESQQPHQQTTTQETSQGWQTEPENEQTSHQTENSATASNPHNTLNNSPSWHSSETANQQTNLTNEEFKLLAWFNNDKVPLENKYYHFYRLLGDHINQWWNALSLHKITNYIKDSNLREATFAFLPDVLIQMRQQRVT